MAAPSSITLGDLSGAWALNRDLSDSSEDLLKLQGISLPIRKILNLSKVTLQVNQYVDEQNRTHIDISQSMTGGIGGTTETRILDWTERSQKNSVFGTVTGRTRWVDLSEVRDEYLAYGFEPGWVVETEVRSDKEGWAGNIIWGFGTAGDGKRHYVRRAAVRKGSQVFKGTFVYDRL